MHSYDTLTDALKDLKARGYEIDFNIAFDKIVCSKNETVLNPHEFEIVEVYRFEGDTNPDDEDVVYAVESKDGTVKGSITSAFGTYAESISTDMIRKLSMHK
ncbi:phosphoribosylpyrophosphate synthetase [Ferruginibacter sp. SUN106]|uniref:phosphoribosylpyrophosphate synthetase n=1 Tax=Ferruginibacter sp. SUN106 TaxID=2978348 RepID=UPI003D36CA1E